MNVNRACDRFIGKPKTREGSLTNMDERMFSGDQDDFRFGIISSLSSMYYKFTKSEGEVKFKDKLSI